MDYKNLKLSIVLGLTMAHGIFATEPNPTNDMFDLDTVIFIEDEVQPELGFSTTDYLPEGFDPYKMYVDLNGIAYIEAEPVLKVKGKRYLPKNFDAYAFPNDIKGFNFIDKNDEIELNFDPILHLPKGFDPYMSN